MAQESCNLDQDEAEILKPSSSSSSPPQPPPAAPSPPALFPTKSVSQEFPLPRPERPEIRTAAAGSSISISSARNPEETSRSQPKTSIPPTSSSTAAAAGCKRKMDDEIPPPARPTNRCSSCQKRVGLTGFRCRCGVLFCARHRYSDAHDCSFDYKSAGREEISKANPVIRAAKIIKI